MRLPISKTLNDIDQIDTLYVPCHDLVVETMLPGK
jgi:hypothetical protein